MSSSVFKEYPSAAGMPSDDDEALIGGIDGIDDCATPALDSNVVVFINKDGSVSVDQSALHELLINDATDTNTSISVIRVGSPTPSLQLELDAAEELEREMSRMHAEEADSDAEANDSNDDNHDDDEEDGEATDESDSDGGEDENDDSDDEDEDADDNAADDEADEKGDDKIADTGNKNGSETAANKRKSRNSRGNRKVSRHQARKVPEKVPQVSLMVESYYSPAEAKQLATQVLSIAGIKDPLQITVDFEYQRFTIANDHSYTTYLSLGELAAIAAEKKSTAEDSSTAHHPKHGRSKLRAPSTQTETITVSDDDDDDDNNDVTNGRPTAAAARKRSDSTAEEDTAAADSNEDGDEAYDESDQSYVSPSESDRDSDLDFNVNDRSTTRTRKLLNRSKLSVKQQKLLDRQQKQLHQQQQQLQNHAAAKPSISSSKKRQSGNAADHHTNADDENAKRKVPLTVKVSKKLPTASTDAVGIDVPTLALPKTAAVPTAVAATVMPNSIQTIQTVKLPSVSNNQPTTRQPVTAQSTTTTPTHALPPTTQRPTTQPIRNLTPAMIQRTAIPNRMILVHKDGSGSTVLTTMPSTMLGATPSKQFTMIRKPQPNGTAATTSPTVSVAGASMSTHHTSSPRIVHAPKRADIGGSANNAAALQFGSPVVAKKPRLDGTTLFSTPDIIKKINSTNSSSVKSSVVVSTATSSAVPANNRITNISVITLPPVTLTPLSASNTMPMNNRTMIIKSASAMNRTQPQMSVIQSQPQQQQHQHRLQHQHHHPLPTPPTPATCPTPPVTMPQQPLQPTRRVNIQAVSASSPPVVRHTAPLHSTPIFKRLPTELQNNWQLQQQPKVVLYAQSASQLLQQHQLQIQQHQHQQPQHQQPAVIPQRPIVLDPPTPPPSSSILSHMAPSFLDLPTDASLLLPDVDLLDGLVNADDGLSEDLLQHVAKLAEDKNLQQVIDQQVLGVHMAAHQHQHTAATFATFAPQNAAALLPNPPIQSTTLSADKTQPRAPSNFANTSTARAQTNRPAQTAVPAATAPAAPAPPPAKEPIKIVRSDGRVITLPPIEAPTTRGAKRRAQIGNTTTSSNSSTPAASPAAFAVRPNAASPALGTPPATPAFSRDGLTSSASTPKSRRASVMPDRRPSVAVRKSNAAAAAALAKASKSSATATPSPLAASSSPAIAMPGATATAAAPGDPVIINLTEDDDDEEEGASDGSYNSEDDPFRLWCICRQPHNNRFMICCDKCEDWFHGKCVSVTKAMGTRMDEQGIEWVCPNCLAKHPHLQQRQQAVLGRKSLGAAATTPVGSRKASTASTSSSVSVSASVSLAEQQPVGGSAPSAVTPVVNATASASGAASSAAASATPIMRPKPDSKSETTPAATPPLKGRVPTPKPPAASSASTKATPTSTTTTATQRVDVFERKTGRVLTGNAAPTVGELKNWLLEHPTFQVVNAGSAHALAIQAKRQQLKQLAQDMQKEKTAATQQQQQHTPQKVQSTLRFGPSKKLQLINPLTQAPHSPTSSQSPTTITNTTPAPAPAAVRPMTPLAAQTPRVTSTPAPVPPKPPKSSSSGIATAAAHQSEPVRQNVVRTLKEQLTIRMRELPANDPTQHPRLSADEIEHFVNATECEMYALFGRDTGMKYRAKYRSIMFNLTDRKNATLFRKICERSCTAADLVRMSAEEMASQELAEWRERETKHQLEMIKKSELDLMACAKTYVLKTHRGEEVIEMASAAAAASDADAGAIEAVVSANQRSAGGGSNNDAVSSTTSDTAAAAAAAVSLGDGRAASEAGDPAVAKDTRIDSRFERSISAALEAKSPAAGASNSTTTSSSKKPTSSAPSSSNKRARTRSRDDDPAAESRSRASASSAKHSRRRTRDREPASDRSHHRDRERDGNSKEHSSKHYSSRQASSNAKSTERSAKDKDKEAHDKSKDKDRTHKETSVTSASSSNANASAVAPAKLRESGNVSSSSNSSYSIKTPLTPIKTTSTPSVVSESDDIIEKILKAQSVIDSVLRPNVPDSNSQDTADKSTTDRPNTAIATKSLAGHQTDEHPSNKEPTAVLAKSAAAKLPLPLWTGSIFMVDVATFQISVCPVLGDVAGLPGDLPAELEIVGRIRAEQVWDYVRKLRKSHSNEVRLVRFSSGTPDDCDAYYTLYEYMLKRKRYGVIKSKVPFVKDFYIFPLESNGTLPAELPQKGTEFEAGRPNLLLGVMVINRLSGGHKPHRSGGGNVTISSTSSNCSSSSAHSAAPLAAAAAGGGVVANASASTIANATSHKDGRFHSPPGSPAARHSSLNGGGIPTATELSSGSPVTAPKGIITVIDDGDEPYSPGGGSDNDTDDTEPPAVLHPPATAPAMPNAASNSSPAAFAPLVPPDNQSVSIPGLDVVATSPGPQQSGDALNPTEIQRKVEELTRQIEEQKMEIAGILHGAAAVDRLDEPYSPSSILDDQNSDQGSAPPSSTVKSALDNIAIPSNLQEILNSIKSSSSSLAGGVVNHHHHHQQHQQHQQVHQQLHQPPPNPMMPPPPSMQSYGAGAALDEYDPYSASANLVGRAPYVANQMLAPSPYVGAGSVGPSSVPGNKSSSKLAQLTDEELMRMVPDDIRASIEQQPQPRQQQQHQQQQYHIGRADDGGGDDQYVP